MVRQKKGGVTELDPLQPRSPTVSQATSSPLLVPCIRLVHPINPSRVINYIKY